jgi:hypothetical protein
MLQVFRTVYLEQTGSRSGAFEWLARRIASGKVVRPDPHRISLMISSSIASGSISYSLEKHVEPAWNDGGGIDVLKTTAKETGTVCTARQLKHRNALLSNLSITI